MTTGVCGLLRRRRSRTGNWEKGVNNTARCLNSSSAAATTPPALRSKINQKITLHIYPPPSHSLISLPCVSIELSHTNARRAGGVAASVASPPLREVLSLGHPDQGAVEERWGGSARERQLSDCSSRTSKPPQRS